MKPWLQETPTTFDELMVFYHDYVKVVYGLVQADGVLPQEMLFEINAAFDHLSRRWIFDESEEEVVKRSYGHLKRCCLDAFKIRFRETSEHRRMLERLDLTGVDNGTFAPKMHAAWARLRRAATEARRSEGQPDMEGQIRAFSAWERVMVDCDEFDRTFFDTPKVAWVRRRSWWRLLREIAWGVALAALVGCSVRLFTHASPGLWLALVVSAAVLCIIAVCRFRAAD